MASWGNLSYSRPFCKTQPHQAAKRRTPSGRVPIDALEPGGLRGLRRSATSISFPGVI